MYDCQGLRNGFWLGKQTVNGFFENENFELILFSEFQNFGEANASPASPVPRPLWILLHLHIIFFFWLILAILD